MVWGIITKNGTGDLRLCESNVNSAYYEHILREKVVPSIERMFPDPQDAIFQHDHATSHTSRATRAVLEDLGIVTKLAWAVS